MLFSIAIVTPPRPGLSVLVSAWMSIASSPGLRGRRRPGIDCMLMH